MDLGSEAAVQRTTGGSRLAKGQSGGGGQLVLIALGCTLAVLAGAYVGLCAYANSSNQFYPHISINGVDVGGLAASAAQEKLEQSLQTREIPFVDAGSGEILATYRLEELGYDTGKWQGESQRRMGELKAGGFFRAGWDYLTALIGVYPDKAYWPEVDRDVLETTVNDFAKTHTYIPVDGSYRLEGDTVLITKAQDGRSVDTGALVDAVADPAAFSAPEVQFPVDFTAVPAKDLTAQAVHDEIAGEMKNAGYDAATDTIIPEQVGAEFDPLSAQGLLDKALPGETVSIPATIEYPAVTAEALKAVLFRDLLGESTTHVSGTGPRIKNVRLSAQAINGYIMNAGDVFSYNDAVGKRTADKGYGPASAYIQGETVDVIGGGICQTSSTLYLACLNSNLEITERYAHRYVVTYMPKGMDATVSWGGPDYKFTNNTDYPIKIVTSMSAKNDLTVQIYGTKTDDITVKMTYTQLSSTPFEVVYEDDPTLPAGTETVKTTPYTGCKVQTYRNLYDKDGNLISSNFEASSNYKSRNKVILRGPGAAASGGAEVPATQDPATNPPSTNPPATNPPEENPDPPVTTPEENNPPPFILLPPA